MDQMLVKIEDMKLQTCFPSHESHGFHQKNLQEYVLADTNIYIGLIRPLVSLDGLVEEFSSPGMLPVPLAISLEIPKIEVTLAEEQIYFLLEVAVNSVNAMQQKKNPPPSQEAIPSPSSGPEEEKKVVEGDSARPSMDLSVSLGLFSVSLSRFATKDEEDQKEEDQKEEDQKEEDKETKVIEKETDYSLSEGVVLLEMKEMRQKMTMYVDGGMQILLCITEIAVEDTRQSPSQFRKILSLHSHSHAAHSRFSSFDPGSTPNRESVHSSLPPSLLLSPSPSPLPLHKRESIDMIVVRFKKEVAVKWAEGAKFGHETIPGMDIDVSMNNPEVFFSLSLLR